MLWLHRRFQRLMHQLSNRPCSMVAFAIFRDGQEASRMPEFLTAEPPWSEIPQTSSENRKVIDRERSSIMLCCVTDTSSIGTVDRKSDRNLIGTTVDGIHPRIPKSPDFIPLNTPPSRLPLARINSHEP